MHSSVSRYMIFKLPSLLMLFVTLLVAQPALAQATDWIVVVNPSVSATTIGEKELSQLMLKKSSVWPGGTTAVPVDGHPDSPVRAAFSKAILRKSVSAVKAYWQQQIFSGRGVPPEVRVTDAEVVAFVVATPGAVGYVAPDTAIGDLKVLEVTE